MLFNEIAEMLTLRFFLLPKKAFERAVSEVHHQNSIYFVSSRLRHGQTSAECHLG